MELNLKINLIESLDNLQTMPKLEKFFISNNRISNLECLVELKQLPALIEVNLEGNPASKMKIYYVKAILSNVKNVQIIDHRQASVVEEEMK